MIAKNEVLCCKRMLFGQPDGAKDITEDDNNIYLYKIPIKNYARFPPRRK